MNGRMGKESAVVAIDVGEISSTAMGVLKGLRMVRAC